MKKISKFIIVTFLCLGIGTKCYSYNFINFKKKINVDPLYISLNELSKALNTTIKSVNDNKIITIKGNEIEFSLGGMTKINNNYCCSSSYKLNSSKGSGILVPKYDEFIVEKDDWFIPLNFLEEKLKLDVEMIDDKVSIKSCNIDELKFTQKSELIDDGKTKSKDTLKDESKPLKTSDTTNSPTQSKSNEETSKPNSNQASKNKQSRSNSSGTNSNNSTNQNGSSSNNKKNNDISNDHKNDVPIEPSKPAKPSESSNLGSSETQESSGNENEDN